MHDQHGQSPASGSGDMVNCGKEGSQQTQLGKSANKKYSQILNMSTCGNHVEGTINSGICETDYDGSAHMSYVKW